MRKILPYVDVVIANEEDSHDVLGISAKNTDIEGGKLDASKYTDVAKEIIKGSLKEGDKFILDAKTFKVKKIL